jgi:hypothetical protein
LCIRGPRRSRGDSLVRTTSPDGVEFQTWLFSFGSVGLHLQVKLATAENAFDGSIVILHGVIRVCLFLRGVPETQRWLRDDIPNWVVLQRELSPKMLAGISDKSVRQKCEQRAAFYEQSYPDRPLFASPLH